MTGKDKKDDSMTKKTAYKGHRVDETGEEKETIHCS